MSVLANIVDLKESKKMVQKLTQTSCHHERTTWQPPEPENNAAEGLSCDDCGEELELLEECF
tara:strand:+ start:573 stop:758 length:186 start_codon:yes stop_codon:yes gene_type:complete